MPRALLSVTDKTGLVDFAKGLCDLGYRLISTGGTAKLLRESGLTVQDVADVTGFPEMMDGRIKTLHPNVHGGLLGDVRQESHRDQMASAGIEPFDLLCVNLYAFEQTVSGKHSIEEAIESIDIGGPAMIRAAAKNHANVTVVIDPLDYNSVLESLQTGAIDRVRLAAKAYRHTAYYDSIISRYLSQASGDSQFPSELTMGLRRAQEFRYGENPHQPGALFRDPLLRLGLPYANQLWGKELSFNNINDANGAWELVSDLPSGACAIIKHTTPCGVAIGRTLADSYELARASDPISAFGGIAAFNMPITNETAEAMTAKGNFLEVVIAPAFDEGALQIFKERAGWGQDVRLLEAELAPKSSYMTLKTVRGGAIVQPSDEDPDREWRVVTNLSPTPDQVEALKLQWAIIPHVKSNAIVVGSPNRMLGVGAGQMNRVQSVRLSLEQAGDAARGAVLASDAFFPFPDSIETAARAGIKAIIQPGGSKKDQEVIDAANELEISMVFTGVRHFLH
ncbi:MAG: bifunctional phosphoribosylaminoimidazolecarboxamide formyltransferase/IMP cyclohydrolase [Fimbriimonadaceae bacterium]